MKRTGLQNAEIQRILASTGHTQYIVVADVGLPIPEGVKTVDLAVTKELPDFISVLAPISEEFVYEKYIYASEMEQANPDLLQEMRDTLDKVPFEALPHEDFKKLLSGARAVIRTGSCRSYANVILIAGVNF